MKDERNNSKPQCKIIKGKNGNVQIEVISEEEALKICLGNYDIVVDRVRMKAFIKIANGKIEEFNGPIKYVDGKPLGLLKKLMQRLSIFLTPYEIGNIGEYDVSYFIKDNLIQYTSKLRNHLFGKESPKFIQTASRPYRLALNGNISFCWIEPDIKNDEHLSPQKRIIKKLPANQQGRK